MILAGGPVLARGQSREARKIAQRFGCLKFFVIERNNRVYSRANKTFQAVKDQARARHTGFGLELERDIVIEVG